MASLGPGHTLPLAVPGSTEVGTYLGSSLFKPTEYPPLGRHCIVLFQDSELERKTADTWIIIVQCDLWANICTWLPITTPYTPWFCSSSCMYQVHSPQGLCRYHVASFLDPQYFCKDITHQPILRLPKQLSAKESTYQCRRYKRWGFDPWVRDVSLEKEMATHSSILAWRIPMDREAYRLSSTGSRKVGHDEWLSTNNQPFLDHLRWQCTVPPRPAGNCYLPFLFLHYYFFPIKSNTIQQQVRILPRVKERNACFLNSYLSHIYNHLWHTDIQ